MKDFRPGTKTWKKFMAKLYGFGAAIVIVGAMFKIMHWPGAGPMLVVGLSTEAIIFAFSAFEPIHEDVDWSLVYPELKGMHDDDHGHDQIEESKEATSITEQLDNLLEEAKIGPELIQSLGAGLKSFSDQASKLSDITDATVATNGYVDSVKSATKNVANLSDTYSKAAESLTGLTTANEASANIGVQMQSVAKNLSALNASYELQLQGSNDHLKSTSKFYDGVTELMKNLNDSVEDTKRYKQEIATLSSNLEQLNTVYGNMLSAMRK